LEKKEKSNKEKSCRPGSVKERQESFPLSARGRPSRVRARANGRRFINIRAFTDLVVNLVFE
jgi:hypothetical protein